MKFKGFIKFLTVGIIGVVTLFATEANGQHRYRMSFDVLNPGPLQLNYQVLIPDVNTQLLLAQGKIKPDGSDIRFSTTCDGASFIPFYIDRGLLTTNTDFWVNVPNLAAGVNKIYMFYGDPNLGIDANFNNHPATFPNADTIQAGQTSNLSGPMTYDWLQVDGTISLLPQALLSITARKVVLNGSIVGEGQGNQAGGPNTAGQPVNGGGAGCVPGNIRGGGGGGHGAVGGRGASSGATTPGGSAIATPDNVSNFLGSGGGGGASFPGGNGGGAVTINTVVLDAPGTINMKGDPAIDHPPGPLVTGAQGGGGSGGGILINTYNIYMTSNSNFDASGGSGGGGNGGGGGGAGGAIKIFYENTGIITSTNVTGGAAGNTANGALSNTATAGGTGLLVQQQGPLNDISVSANGETDQTFPLTSSNPPNHIFCAEELATIIASPGNSSYEFFLNGNSLGSSGSNTLSRRTFSDGDSIYVIGTEGTCSLTSDTLVVTINPLPIVTAVQPADYCINGGKDTLTYVPSSGGMWEGTGITNQFLGIFDPATSGLGSFPLQYIYTINSTGCKDTAFITAVVNDKPFPNITDENPKCIDTLPFNFMATPAGGVFSGPGITNTTTGRFEPAVAGADTHTIRYDVTNADGCSDFDETTIVIRDLPDPTITFSGPFCETSGLQTLTAATGGGTWFGYGITNQSTGEFDPLFTGQGSYQIIYCVNDPISNCSNCDTVMVNVYAGVLADAGLAVLNCEGDPAILGGNPAGQGGSGTLSYSWTPTTYLNNPNAANPLASPPTDQQYTLTVTDSNAVGCIAVDSVVVEYQPGLILDVGNDTFVCAQGSVILGGNPTASGGQGTINYSWAPNIGFINNSVPNPSASPPSSLTYTLTIQDSVGCDLTDSVFVLVHQSPTATAFPGVFRTDTICDGVSIGLGGFPSATGGTGPYLYSWSPTANLDNSFSPNPIASPSFNTTYSLTVQDQNGCIDIDTIELFVDSKPLVDAGSDSLGCSGGGNGRPIGGSPTALGGNPGYTYAWTPANTLNDPTIANPIANPSQTTTYSVVVTDARGCQGSDVVEVNLLNIPKAEAGPNKLICLGDQVTLGGNPTANNGNHPYAYAWSPNIAINNTTIPNPVSTPQESRSYFVTITDSNGCTSTDSIFVNVVQEVTPITVGFEDQYCIEDKDVSLIGKPAGGTFSGPGITDPGKKFGDSYVGNNLFIPDNSANGVTASFIVNGAPGTTLGKDIFLSSIELNIEHTHIGDLKVLLLNPAGNSVILFDRPGQNGTSAGCAGSDLSACFVAGSGFPTTAEGICNPHTPTIQGTFTAEEDINQLNNNTAIFGVWRLIITDRRAGNTGKLKSWKINFGTPAKFNPSAAGAGNHNLTYNFDNCYNCNNVTTVPVIVVNNPVIDAGKDITICDGDHANLGGIPTAQGTVGPYRYRWTPDRNLDLDTIPNPLVTPDTSINYSLEVTDKNGCVSNDEIQITYLEGPQTGFTWVANGNVVDFTNTSVNGKTYAWDLGDGNIANVQNPIHTYQGTGIFEVCLTTTGPNGCSLTYCDSVDVRNFSGINTVHTDGLEIYPNPVTAGQQIKINFDGDVHNSEELRILDMNGRIVYSMQEDELTSVLSSNSSIDVSHLPSGTYSVWIRTNDALFINKFLKLN